MGWTQYRKVSENLRVGTRITGPWQHFKGNARAYRMFEEKYKRKHPEIWKFSIEEREVTFKEWLLGEQ